MLPLARPRRLELRTLQSASPSARVHLYPEDIRITPVREVSAGKRKLIVPGDRIF
jgi:hypothetical protein